ncbi:conserved domain protein [Devosia sp. DBB001]|nr:conserved domain protein [Devosia sp. DBB001]
MHFDWFSQRRYRHFDNPIPESRLQALIDPTNVARHAFSPLILKTREVKRYKPKKHKTEIKRRPIMYASHQDAAILSFYSKNLILKLEDFYSLQNVGDNVLAYRTLGKANYHFASEVHQFAVENSPCCILAFDVEGFFDNLDHRRLKSHLKVVLGVANLPADWYAIYKYITKFSFIDYSDLEHNENIKERLSNKTSLRIASIREIKDWSIPFRRNGEQLSPPRLSNAAGIPQGTPISAAVSNVYMTRFDVALSKFAKEHGALYRRYSDDIILVCKREVAAAGEAEVTARLKDEALTLSSAKTERTLFPPAMGTAAAQYLGFQLYPDGVAIRSSSMARQARKIRKAVRKAKYQAIQSDGKLRTRKLTKRFTFVWDAGHDRALRNFSAYAERSAVELGKSKRIGRQSSRMQNLFRREIAKARKELL